MPGLLQTSQRHDLHQAAHVQRLPGGVKPDVGRERTLQGGRIQALDIRGLVDVSALKQESDEVGPGFEFRKIGFGRHGRFP